MGRHVLRYKAARHKTSTEEPASKTPSCEMENTQSTLDMLLGSLLIWEGHRLEKQTESPHNSHVQLSHFPSSWKLYIFVKLF